MSDQVAILGGGMAGVTAALAPQRYDNDVIIQYGSSNPNRSLRFGIKGTDMPSRRYKSEQTGSERSKVFVLVPYVGSTTDAIRWFASCEALPIVRWSEVRIV